MPRKLEVLFKVEYTVDIDTTTTITSFIQSQIPSLNISGIKIDSKGKVITAVVTSNILSLIPATENYVAGSSLDLKTLNKNLGETDYLVEAGHTMVTEVLQNLTMKYIQAKEELEKYEELKVEHEKLQKLLQGLSKENVMLKSSGEERKERFIIEEIKDYIEELLSVYDILKEVVRKRLDQIKTKEESLNSYRNMIKKIKEDGSKGAQLKMLNEMKKNTPFMTAIALREDNIRIALLGVTAVANVKHNKLLAHSDEIEQCNSLLKFAEEKLSAYRQRHLVNNLSKKDSLLN
jgi:hypothetical protein